MKNLNIKLLSLLWLSTAILTLFAKNSFAELTPHSLSTDKRIKIVNYDPNNVTAIHAHYGYETDIVFGENEVIQNVSLGDSLAWQAVPVNRHLFLKPMTASNTNMTILTNSRAYNFQLEAKESQNLTDQTYQLKFIYPDEINQYQKSAVVSGQNLSPLQLNWKYAFTGDKETAPIQAFDNGKFTYFKFPKTGKSIQPAIFSVDKNRHETLLNYHIDGDYLVVNRIAKQFTLRNGKSVTCIYNEA